MVMVYDLMIGFGEGGLRTKVHVCAELPRVGDRIYLDSKNLSDEQHDKLEKGGALESLLVVTRVVRFITLEPLSLYRQEVVGRPKNFKNYLVYAEPIEDPSY